MQRIRITRNGLTRYFLIRWMMFCTIHFFSGTNCFGQASEQAWVEYMVNLPFANSYNIEFAGTYSANFESPRWRALDLQLTPEWAITPNIDLMGALLVSKTNQNDSMTTFEFREMLGTRIHFTPNRRILTRMLVRFEQRNFRETETDAGSKSMRSRVRFETIVPLNKPTIYSGDKLWYAMADFEAFFVKSDVEERFADRIRLRVGPGYRVNYGLRLEFLYTWQLSRNTLEDDFESSANIFRFRIKQYLHKSKPSKAQGMGN